MNKKGIVLTIISALIYGFTPVLCFFTYEMGNNSMTLTFFRNLFVIPVLFSLMVLNKVDFTLSKKEALDIVVVGIFGAVFTTLLLYTSYSYIGVGTATTLHFMYPIFVVLICKFIYRDVVKKNQIIASIIAIVGISFFINFNDLGNIKGILMALISGVTFAIYLVLIEKRNLALMNGYKLSFYIAVVVGITLSIINLKTNQIIFNQPITSYLLMFAVSMLASFLGIILLKEGIKLIGSSMASMFSLFEPISSIVFGAIFLHEVVTFNKVIGSIIIVIAMIILTKKN